MKAHAELHRRWEIDEARSAGNPDFDIHGDWIDYVAAGATGPDDLYHADPPGARCRRSCRRDILDLGLRSQRRSATTTPR